jgi:hypothetical protein
MHATKDFIIDAIQSQTKCFVPTPRGFATDASTKPEAHSLHLNPTVHIASNVMELCN